MSASATAARLLLEGKLVAFPTETVYGLGADAMQSQAVRRIFALKGRPASHPLIVHLPQASGESRDYGEALAGFAANVPAEALELAAAFWPGPLTLILRRHRSVPDEVTGGLDTVGLRVPRHPVALSLLAELQRLEAGRPAGIAAPSANRFGRVSPTTADHVAVEFGSELLSLDALEEPVTLPASAAGVYLDGGAAEVGIESTILDLSGSRPIILRPGGVSQAELALIIGRVDMLESGEQAGTRAPGLLAQHYAPRARVELVTLNQLAIRAAELQASGLAFVSLTPSADAADDAHQLYARLREADAAGAAVILAVLPEGDGLSAAIRDRLRRAAGIGSLPEST